MKKLSRRQREIIELAKMGMTSKGIAASLGIALNTVLVHRKSLLRKIGVHSMTEAIAKHMGEK
jgi:DNA-binding NarL/FixJ family response regulator